MSRESLGWFVAGALAVLVCTLGAMQQQGGVGRFQLVEGKYQIVGETSVIDAVSTWRIDTVTGEVSEYRSVTAGKRPGVGWVRVPEFKD